MFRCAWVVLAAAAWGARAGPGPPARALDLPGGVPPPPPPGDLHCAFAFPVYNFTIPENSPPRTHALPPPDEPLPGVPRAPDTHVRFRIRHGDKDKFFKAEERCLGDFCLLWVRTRAGLADVLNRERRDVYRLGVRALCDSPQGALHADAELVINVSDVNDLSPLFYPTEYDVTVPEDAQLHSSVARLTAEDADLGLNGQIFYSFDENTDRFAIHPVTGVVTVTRPLSYVEKSEFELTVLARDRASLLTRGEQAPAARARLRVRVLAANVHAPELSARTLSELDAADQAFAIVLATDRDTGEHGRIADVDIVDGDPDGHFRVQRGKELSEWEIVAHPLRAAVVGAPLAYNLTVRARDAGSPPRSAYLTLNVRARPPPPPAPVFARELYAASVTERAPPGTPLVRLKLAEREERVDVEIVGGNEGGEFRVHPETGVLYTAAPLDAERRRLYTLTVAAIDRRAGVLAAGPASAKVEVSVTDANDNDPVFEESRVEVRVRENGPAGAAVARLVARDADSGENGYVSYSLANEPPLPFEVEHFSGVVRTTRVLDYESMRRRWTLRVRASDWGLPFRRQAEAEVIVTLEDVNDNRPQFERIDCEGHLPRNLPVGAEILTLSAIDFDAGDVVSYRLVGGNEDGCFTLDSSTGVLSLACAEPARDSSRHLNVTATDGTHFADATTIILHSSASKVSGVECRETGAARRLAELLAAASKDEAASESVDVTPTPTNAHSPEFIDFPVEVKVNESVALGAILVRLQARDFDEGYDGLVQFSVSGGDDDSVFRVDPDSGELRVIGHLDREREPEYFLNVTVRDCGNPPRATSRLLPVTVLDVNDNAPAFLRPLMSFRVAESARNGTVVCKLEARDADAGEFGRVRYSAAGAGADVLCVDAEDGTVRVCAPLDREARAEHELSVWAHDGGGRGAEARVRVRVEDVNDVAPAFALPAYSARVPEGLPRGAVVAVLEAWDPDLGAGGRLRYSLPDESPEDPTFTVDEHSGVVRLAKILDYEERQVYSMVVRAEDGGGLWGAAALALELADADENWAAPAWGARALAARVPEDAPRGARVAALRASDADPGQRLAYYIRDGSGMPHFSIDDTGDLKTLTPLDRETTDSYWLTVCAEDNAVVPKYSCIPVWVEVGDVNDEAPWFARAEYRAEVSEQAPRGELLAAPRATDRDLPAAAGDQDHPATNLTYRIVAGNPDGLFDIDPRTGAVVTSGRALDREAAPRALALELAAGDGRWAGGARLHLTLADRNDNAPAFTQRYYELRVPVPPAPSAASAATPDQPPTLLPQTEESAEGEGETSARGDFLVYDEQPPKGIYLGTVCALDDDAGENGTVRYSLRAGGGAGLAAGGDIRVHARTGRLLAARALPPNATYDLTVRACDGGRPPRCSVARVSLRTEAVSGAGAGAPPVLAAPPTLQATELDAPGFLLTVLQATAHPARPLYYDIVAGDAAGDFFLGREDGSLVLARRLRHERVPRYLLNVSVTDGLHTVFTTVNITVINDVNEGGVWFSREVYEVEVAEDARPGLALVQLQAAVRPAPGDPAPPPGGTAPAARVVYGLAAARAPASLPLFRLDELTGVLELAKPLDSSISQVHELSVWASDGAPVVSRAAAHVVVRVAAAARAPEWSRRLVSARVVRGAPAGALVARVAAALRGPGRVRYSLAGGGGALTVHADLGEVRLTRALPAWAPAGAPPPPQDFTATLRAHNDAAPAATAPALTLHVLVVDPDDAPPRFSVEELVLSVGEDALVGAAVGRAEAAGGAGLQYALRGDGTLRVSPAAGTLHLAAPLDYENRNEYNFTLIATNMGGGRAELPVRLVVVDRNEHAPALVAREWEGSVREGAAPGALVRRRGDKGGAALVLAARDRDSAEHAAREFRARDAPAAFRVDPVTGAVLVAGPLDYETQSYYEFTVTVSDAGTPRVSSWSEALVRIWVEDENDEAPRFSQGEYRARVSLPTLAGQLAARVLAVDPEGARVHYSLLEGDAAAWVLDDAGGVRVRDPAAVRAGLTALRVRAWDGARGSVARVLLLARATPAQGLAFPAPALHASVAENSTRAVTLTVLTALGTALHEHVTYTILNPDEHFEIGVTSGAVRTTGVPLDRETRDNYTLVVEARAGRPPAWNADADTDAGGERAARVALHVAVLDVNDNCPVFRRLPYEAAVAPDHPIAQPIFTLDAVDLDAGDNGEVRYEMKRGAGELFRVERRSGEVFVRQALEAGAHDLVVAAFDGGARACGAEARLAVRAWGGGAGAPRWPHARAALSVREGAPPGTRLQPALRALSPLGRALLYSLRDALDHPHFRLHIDTARDRRNNQCWLETALPLDYEHVRAHELVVLATDPESGRAAALPLSVSVLDDNDHAPALPPAPAPAPRVLEDAPPGTLVLCLPATDPDTGAGGAVQYSLRGADDATDADADDDALSFEVDAAGCVRVRGALDAETCARHHVLLTARDQGEPPLASTLHLFIDVVDVNDNAPVWEAGGAACVLRAGARDGAVLCAVRATDADAGDNVTYSLAAAAPPYRVHPRTGLITLQDAAAAVSAGALTLHVAASDGAHSVARRVRVTLEARAAPDGPRFPHAQLEARVPENAPPGTLLTTVRAFTDGAGEEGAVRYWIPSARLSEVFSVDAVTGAVRTRVPLDRERRGSWLVPVLGTARGRLAHTALRVRVTDENDNAPRFPHDEYVAQSAARAGPLAAPPPLWARDPDVPDAPAPLRYELRDVRPEGLLRVHPDTGALAFTDNITQHERAVVSGWVVARDAGGRAGEAALRVCAGGVAGGGGALAGAVPPRLFLREDAAPGELLATLPPARARRYRLAAPHGPDAFFDVDAAGRLLLAAPLDRETQPIHYIGIIAESTDSEDSEGAACGVMLQTALHVLDVNDNAPEFHSARYELAVSEAVPPHSRLLQVVAEDLDAGSNGEVRYSIEWAAGEEEGPFAVDAESGWVRTTRALDREARAAWLVPLVAADAGSPPRHERAELRVTLLDENDSPPEFVPREYAAAVREDAAPGTVALRLELRDADAAPAPLAFYITEGDARAHWRVNAAGELYVARALDRELRAAYALRVLATDGVHAASAAVALTVLDVNDNPPYCEHDSYNVSVSESAAVGTALLALQVRDEDSADNARVRFFLRGDGADDFALDKDSGELRVARALDREARAQYRLAAHAQDRARPAWGCSAAVLVRVEDANDNAPRFGAARYEATLPEDAAPGALVARVAATDPDLGLAGLVRYELAAPSAAFRLDPASGVLTLRAPLDRETAPQHRLEVVARDAGDPPLSATTLVLLTVADVNDNPPEFERRQYDALAPELLAPGTQLLRVHALSRDAGVNADVYYSIVDGDERGDFAVDRNTGVISVARPLDYETIKSYSLSVQAVDGGTPPLTDLTLVNVTVVDANDNAPTFAQGEFVARVREDAPVGERVLQAVASDADAGLNGRVTYWLARDAEGLFAVDADTGYVTLAAALDRERAARHELELRARDRGAPASEGAARLVVLVLDANDNAPQFARAEFAAVVRSDRAPGHALLRLDVTDADAPPNAAPFTFDFQSGNEQGAFRIEQDGVLRTAALLDHRIKDHYTLQVRVFDNGSPPLFGDCSVSVRVVEESQFPPVVTPLEVLVVAARGLAAGGALGHVRALDRDRFDALAYALAPPHALFTLDATTGELRAAPGLEPARYDLNATVSDGKFSGSAPVSVTVLAVPDELLAQAVVVRFRAVTEADFVLSHRKGFLRAVREAMDCEPERVLLLGVQPAGASSAPAPAAENEVRRRRRQVAADLDVALCVRGAPAELLRRRLHAHVERIEERTRLVLEELVRAPCPPCPPPRACRETLAVRPGPARVISTDVFSLVSPPFAAESVCVGASDPRVPVDTGETLQLSGDGFVELGVQWAEGVGGASGSLPLQDELTASLQVRTRARRGTLLWARGPVDELALEVEEGALRLRLQLGSGEAVVWAGPLADGAWHAVTLERRGGWARLTLDKHSAHAHAPPPAASLDLADARLYLGAALLPHAHALAAEQVTRGFVGCMREVRVLGAALRLREREGEGGVSPLAGGAALRVLRAPRVQLGACAPPAAPAPCDHHPCLNGGTCSASANSSGGWACSCHARFSGAACEQDTSPCASAPCLHGARCEDAGGEAGAGWRCACPAGLAGARCERGRHCPAGAAVCAHGGACEEGARGPVCHCRGYFGPRCQFDVDECAGEPCLNGATCLNEPGSFRCLCPPDKTGMNCGNPLYSDAVTAGGAGGADGAGGGDAVWRAVWSWARAAGAGAGAGVALWGAACLVLLLLCAVCATLACRRRAQAAGAGPPPKGEGPAGAVVSAAPGAGRADKLTNLRAAPPAPLNNMDTLRSYGSAGDELELPRDYRRNLCPPDPPCKPWSDQMHLHTFSDNKIYNDLKGSMAARVSSPVSSVRTVRMGGVGAGVGVGAGAGAELVGGYHWDCSDWCGAPAPGITEVCARSERRDSSSPPPPASPARRRPPRTPRTPRRPPAAAAAALTDTSSGLDDDPLFTDESACPLHGSEGEGEGRALRRREPDAHSLITIEERESLLGGGGGGGRGSCSDVSARLCDFDDSDEEEGDTGSEGGGGPAACRHTDV